MGLPSPTESLDDLARVYWKQRRDDDIFSRIAEMLRPKAEGLAAAVVGNRIAPDVVQEALIRLWNSNYDPLAGPVEPYFSRIVVNLSIDHLRRSKRQELLISEVFGQSQDMEEAEIDVSDLARDDETPGALLVRAEERLLLIECIIALPAESRLILVLTSGLFGLEMTNPEVEEALGLRCPRSGIRAGVHQAIIPRDLFYRVREVLQKRSVDTGEKGRLEFLLRGVACCRVCGQRLTGEVHPRGTYYRCIPSQHRPKCDQPYSPVKALDGQLVTIYERLQPPRELLELLKHEMETIARRRKKIAEQEIGSLRRTVEDIETKELKLLDEMLAGKAERSVYERMQRRYADEKRQAEARLSQMEVDYDDPLDFLDKCIVVASTLLYLHRRFSFEQRKNLLRAVFERIEVEDRAIVSVKLNPPFSILMRDDLGRLFKDCPPAGTTQYLARALRALASRFSVQKRPIFLFLLLAESQKQTFSEYLVSNIKRRFS